MTTNSTTVTDDFIEWVKTQPEYNNLVFQFGASLFAMDDGQFRAQPLRLAYAAFIR